MPSVVLIVLAVLVTSVVACQLGASRLGFTRRALERAALRALEAIGRGPKVRIPAVRRERAGRGS